jgi:hypothetical protein
VGRVMGRLRGERTLDNTRIATESGQLSLVKGEG